MLKGKIYNYFQSKESKREISKEITFAPSYFTSCKRQIFYKKIGQEASNPISEASYFKMALGSSSHEKIQDILKDIGILQECEDMKTIDYKGLTFNYRLDGIVEIEGKKYIIEIKTVYAAGFRSIEEKPKSDHFIQLQCYLNFENIEDGLILYVGRDNGFIVEHYIKRDSQFVDNKIDELKELKKMIEKKELPDKDFQIQLKNTGEGISEYFTKDKIKYKSNWQCSYCAYHDKCWSKELQEIKNNKFYINKEFIK